MKKALLLLIVITLVVFGATSCEWFNKEKYYTDCLEFSLLPDGTYGVKAKSNVTAETIKIPDTHDGVAVTQILPEAFFAIDSITSITIPDSITTIGEEAFSFCSGLTEIKLGKGVTKIASYSFSNCENLSTFIPSDGLEYIGSYAFYRCDTLSAFEVGKNINFIGNRAFYECDNLEVYVRDMDAWLNSISVSYDTMSNLGSIDYGINSLHIFDKSGNEITELVIPDYMTKIPACAFEGAKSIISVTIPKNVETIGSNAFSGCDNIKDVYIKDLDSWLNICAKGYEGSINSNSSIIFDMTAGAYLDFELDITNANFADILVYLSSYESIYSTSNYLTKKGTLHLLDENGREITDLTIPDGVTLIPADAFYNANNLTHIKMPSTVKYIGKSAFSTCDNLESVEISENVTSIGSNAFSDCTSLKSIDLPSGITTIYYSTFSGCTSLKSIDLPSGITTIHNSAFWGCTSLTNIVIPDSVITIDHQAFYNCPNIRNVTIPKNVQYIGESAFSCCYLDSITVDEDNKYYYSKNNCVVEISTKTLILGCDNSIIPDGVKIIGNSAFRNLSTLSTITIPDSVEIINRSAFERCSNLLSITIPKSVKVIDEYAFYNCNNLYIIYNYSNLPFEIGSDSYGSIAKNAKIIIKKDSMISPDNGYSYILTDDGFLFEKGTSYYLIAYAGGENTVTLPKDINGESYNIKNMRGVINVKFPNGFTSISRGAFSGCHTLVSIEIPDSVTSIGDNAFYNCDSLTSVVIGDSDSVTSIGNSAFANCDSLTSVVIGDSVTSIGNSAFANCDSLISVVIGDSVTSIGNGAFRNCKQLTNIVIPNGVTQLQSSTFDNCSTLREVVIGSGVEMISNSAFSGCSNLSSITVDINNSRYYSLDNCIITNYGELILVGCNSTIPDGVRIISSNALSNCNHHSKIEIPTSVIEIRSYAFEDCESLREIAIPRNVSKIYGSAFVGCKNLISITVDEDNSTYYSKNNCIITRDTKELVLGCKSSTIPNEITSIGDYAFSGCDIENIVIPDNVTHIGEYAFSNCQNIDSIIIHDGVNYIGYNAFYNTSYYKNKNNWENNALYIGKHLIKVESTVEGDFVVKNGTKTIAGATFYDCKNLTSIVIPDGVVSIGNNAFYNCDSLTNVVIPDSVTEIGDSAFQNCDQLISIVISDSVVKIGSRAFYGCQSLDSIYYCGSEDDWTMYNLRIESNSDVTIYFYSETPSYGNYWHYDSNGEIVIWN